MRFLSTTQLLVGLLSLLNSHLLVTRLALYDSLFIYMYTGLLVLINTHMNERTIPST